MNLSDACVTHNGNNLDELRTKICTIDIILYQTGRVTLNNNNKR